MSEIEKFSFDGTDVRTVVVDGEPWFVASDVTDVLGYTRSRDAIRDHVLPDQKGRAKLAHPTSASGYSDAAIVNEAGLYRLIMRSKATGAQRFQAWVTDEVLPTLRKTGGAYITPGSQAELDLTDPDTALDKLIEIAQVAKEYRAKNKVLEAKVAEDAPAVAAAQKFFDLTNELYSRREAARMLDIPERLFMDMLREWGWFEVLSNAAKAYAVNQGYAQNKTYITKYGDSLVYGKLTTKGVERANRKLVDMAEAK